MKGTFRLVTKSTEILSQFITLVEDGTECLLWKKNNGAREVVAGTIDSFDSVHKVAVFLFYETSIFKLKDELYLISDKEDFTIKVEVISVSQNKCSFALAHEMRAIEKREFPRTAFNFDHNVRCVIEKSENYGSKIRTYGPRVIDISDRGLSLNVNIQLLPKFSLGATLCLRELKGKILDRGIEGRVVYQKDYHFKSGQNVIESYKVGIALKESWK